MMRIVSNLDTRASRRKWLRHSTVARENHAACRRAIARPVRTWSSVRSVTGCLQMARLSCLCTEIVHSVAGVAVSAALPGRRAERESFARLRPRFRHMGGSLVGFGEAFGGVGAVGSLPEDAGSAFAIRLERDPLAVGRPDGYRFLPPNVICRIELLRRSGKPRFASFPSSVPTATCLPSGENRET